MHEDRNLTYSAGARLCVILWHICTSWSPHSSTPPLQHAWLCDCFINACIMYSFQAPLSTCMLSGAVIIGHISLTGWLNLKPASEFIDARLWECFRGWWILERPWPWRKVVCSAFVLSLSAWFAVNGWTWPCDVRKCITLLMYETMNVPGKFVV